MLSIYQVFELGGTSFGVTFFLSGITVNWFVVVFFFCFVFLPCMLGKSVLFVGVYIGKDPY